MMSGTRVIWKYELHPGTNEILVPPRSRIVGVAAVEPGSDAPAVLIERARFWPATRTIRVRVVGTGESVPVKGAHIGSAWCGPFMWHAYELASGGAT